MEEVVFFVVFDEEEVGGWDMRDLGLKEKVVDDGFGVGV